MSEHLAPGVYIDELSSTGRTIEGVSTRIAGFVGTAERGPTHPTLVRSWTEYTQRYGGFIDLARFERQPGFLPYAVRGFFENGGQRLVIARVTGERSTGAVDAVASLDDYVGASTMDPPTGLAALAAIKGISLMAVPDDVVIDGLAAHLIDTCERLRDRFAVTTVPHPKQDVSSIRPLRETSWGATYYPWIRVPASHTPEGTKLIPPAGHICGIYARVDATRGVHKAPANEPVEGIVLDGAYPGRGPLSHGVTSAEQDVLNPRGVNVIRDFRPTRGVLVWGARTMSVDPEWKYINVRRFCLYLEQSIDRGLQWVAFEPNGEPAWLEVRRCVEEFLQRVWRDGALVGSRAEEAFFVRCDRTTMTQDDIGNGRLICKVGVAMVRPAEFVILRFQLKANGA